MKELCKCKDAWPSLLKSFSSNTSQWRSIKSLSELLCSYGQDGLVRTSILLWDQDEFWCISYKTGSLVTTSEDSRKYEGDLLSFQACNLVEAFDVFQQISGIVGLGNLNLEGHSTCSNHNLCRTRTEAQETISADRSDFVLRDGRIHNSVLHVSNIAKYPELQSLILDRLN